MHQKNRCFCKSVCEKPVCVMDTDPKFVAAGPLHLAYARPLCGLKAPLGLSLLRKRQVCRGRAAPSCLRKTALWLKSPTGAFIAAQTPSLSRQGCPSCLRKTALWLHCCAKKPHWGFHCCANAKFVAAGLLHLAYARPLCGLKAPLGLSLLRKRQVCRGRVAPSCLRKTALWLKSPTGAFIAAQTPSLSRQGRSILLTQDRFVA